MCSKNNPFHVLSQYLYRKRDVAILDSGKKVKQGSPRVYPINYEKLINMIPSNLG
jgi:hypothetical protein